MNASESSNQCPKCGAAVPAEAAQGLCPKCVLAAVATPTEIASSPASGGEVPSLERVAAAFPQFEIIELIGRGGMGLVFKARQKHLDRYVALKLLSDKLARDPQFAERFNREGRVLARLNHPNIVSVYDFGQTGGFYYLVMEFVDGVNLRQAMRTGKFSPAEALAIVPKICEALQFAHEEGILHRDIKPENILLDGKGRVKIADFGIAKLVGDTKAEVTLTATGAALGTPHYMAPEQLEKPSEVDHRADIYSLGVVFYEMLTGELPIGRFAAPSAKTSIDERVDEIVLRALAKERELRQQSAGEMKTQVEDVGKSSAPLGTSAGASAAAQIASAPRLTNELRIIFLVVVSALFGLALVDLLPALRRIISVVLRGLPGAAREVAVTIPAMAMGGALTWLAWQYRWRLLGPLGLLAPSGPAVQSDKITWSLDHALSVIAKLCLVTVAFRTGIQVVALLGVMLGLFDGGDTHWGRLAQGMWIWMVAGGGAILVGASGARAAGVVAAQSPAWVRRAGFGFMALAAVAMLPTILTWNTNREWHLGSLLILTGFALLTLRPAWRQLALAADSFALLLGFPIQVLPAALRRDPFLDQWTPGAPEILLNPQIALVLGLLQYLAFVAGVVILLHPDVKRLFGLAPAAGSQPSPVSSAVGAAPVTGQTESLSLPRWSQKAIWGAVAVALSLPFPLILIGAVSSGRAGLNQWELVLAFLVGFFPALAGTVLGWIALSDLRMSQGRLRGLPLAIFGALAWPLLLLAAAILIPTWLIIVHTAPLGGPIKGSQPLIGSVAFLVSVAALLAAVWVVSRTVRWARGERVTRRFGAARWLAGIVAFCAVIFVVARMMRLAPQISSVDGALKIELPRPLARQNGIPWPGGMLRALRTPRVAELHLTFTSVELREEADRSWLAMDYVEEVHGDCELTVRTDETGTNLQFLTRKTSFLKNSGAREIRHQRLEWRLPESVERENALHFRDDVAAQWLRKSLAVRPGDEKTLFQLDLPEGGTVTGSVGARFRGQAP